MHKLTLESLRKEAAIFSADESRHAEKSLFGVTDGLYTKKLTIPANKLRL